MSSCGRSTVRLLEVAMANAPARPTDGDLPPGVVRVFKEPGLPTLRFLSADAWARQTGVGDHVSLSVTLSATPDPLPTAARTSRRRDRSSAADASAPSVTPDSRDGPLG